MTDDANGDALFVDDIYTALPGTVAEQQARIAQIDEIRAGAGDDVVDMTSQRFACVGDGVKIYGGLGNDTIWANNGNNILYGDAGNDRYDQRYQKEDPDFSADLLSGLRFKLGSVHGSSPFLKYAACRCVYNDTIVYKRLSIKSR